MNGKINEIIIEMGNIEAASAKLAKLDKNDIVDLEERKADLKKRLADLGRKLKELENSQKGDRKEGGSERDD